jgi:hypothetical protein
LLRRQCRKSRHAERHEQKTHPGALDDAVETDRPLGHVWRPTCHIPHRPGAQPKADCQQHARVEAPDEPAHGHHRDESAEPPRRQGKARRHDRVAHQILQIERQEGQRGEIGEADDEAKERAGGEVAIAEQSRVHERRLGREGLDQEQPEGRAAHHRLSEDFPGAEPIELLAAIEQNL